MRELELERCNDGQDHRMGNEDFTKIIRDEEGGRNGRVEKSRGADAGKGVKK